MEKREDITKQSPTESELIKKAFGEVLARHRSEAGFQQRPFSRVVGISNSHLRGIEAGNTSPTLVTLFKLASTLEESPRDLIGEVCDEVYKMRPTTSLEYHRPRKK